MPLRLPPLFLTLYLSLLMAGGAWAQSGPEIVVEYPAGTELVRGGTVDWGKETQGMSRSLPIKIRNIGDSPLTDVRITSAGDFTQSSLISFTIAPGGELTLDVKFSPSALGLHTATLNIISNDADENPFDFQATGTGVVPQFVLEDASGMVIPDGGTYDLGSAAVNGLSTGEVFFRNIGDGRVPMPRFFTDSPVFPGGYTGPGFPYINPGGRVTCALAFFPTRGGPASGKLTVKSSPPGGGALVKIHEITLTGTGLQPVIQVEQPVGSVIASGGGSSFGAVVPGDTASLTFTIKNTGTATMHISQTILDGTNMSDFSLTAAPASTVGAGESTTMTVRFTPQALGLRQALLRIVSDAPFFTGQTYIPPYYYIPVSGTGLPPVIQVEEPVGSVIASGGGRDFGNVTPGGTASLNFTIKNTGLTTMHISGTTWDGANTGDFSLAAAPASTLAAGESTPVTVRFTPRALGLRQARLHIVSDAVYSAGQTSAPPFFIRLSGAGVLSRISFGATSYSASHGDSEKVVTITRTPAQAAVTVTLDAADGPPNSMPPIAVARAMQDYVDISGQARVLSFAAGEAQKTVSIQLLAPTALAGTHRRLLLILNNPGAWAELDTPATVPLDILAADTAKPTLTLPAPAAGKVSGLSPLIVKGTAGDAKGIRRVEVRLNNATPIPITNFGPGATSTSLPFTAQIEPVDGSNVLVVTAYDMRENSTSVTRSFTFERRRQMSVQVQDTENPGLTNIVTMTMTVPAGKGTALSPTAPQSFPKSAAIVPGTLVKLVMTPKTGLVVDRYVIEPVSGQLPVMDTQVVENVCTFTMPDADITVRAETAASPFVPPAGATNRVHLLLDPNPEESKHGYWPFKRAYLTGTLTVSGGFTGKLFRAGQSVPITTKLLTKSAVIFTIAGRPQESQPVPDATLRLEPSGVAGIPFKATFDSYESVDARWARYSKGQPVPAGLLNLGAKGGLYNLSFAPPYELSIAPPYEIPYRIPVGPSGHGYASLSLTNAGVVTATGVLAEGTSFTMSSDLLDNWEAPLFAQLPNPGATANRSSLLKGMLRFRDPGAAFVPPQPPDITAELLWHRYPYLSLTPTYFLYPTSWPRGGIMAATGIQYSPDVTYHAGLGLAASTASSTPNASLRFSGAYFADQQITHLNLMNFTVTKVPANDSSFTLSINRAMGIFTGTFTPVLAGTAISNPGKPAFRGILLNRVPYLQGLGHFINHSNPARANRAGAVILGAPAQE